ncbi:5'-nucleosidase [Campylobacter sp. RM9344]|uniref:5'-nucleosidase n=1 Tax=Campylobacter californiensis TaxID=1032243 RepID=A0AAW3ZVZ4_9BACT|nr:MULTISPECIES: 5'-nucleosidase [unclassified Campylobacter]MBE2984133.1 5'-nucleosidase [Campylobacter sp. RM6883]MBE2986243.1 5'-nucleosidase [Campylobacter sp. RM12919]MBE2988240.1 5'-nucleosidase [Campylobacter sp. RM12920]MBE2995795.1 5'-nucleosidase [Campylobacter sp. RM6913]MBE3030159.1 5'-nucleosidase [Campylobacter sp. RM9344]
MLRILFVVFVSLKFTFAYDIPVDCTQIFEARKAEILKEVERIDEERQALEAFRASTQAAYESSMAKLSKKEADINATMRVVDQKRREIDERVAQNEEILKELRTMTTDKVSESYAKMKDQSAADVLSQMSRAQAATIMYALEPKKISTVMAKMEPKVASEITILLTKGPPFVDEPKDVKFDAPAGNLLE